MRYHRAAALFAIGLLAVGAHALPAVTYSVVDVGGPSAESANTIYATVTAPSLRETVTEHSAPNTVTEKLTFTIKTPAEPTATKSWSVTVGETVTSVVTATVVEQNETPLPIVAATDTVYYTVPAAPAPETTLSSSSASSTTFMSTFATAISSQRSHSSRATSTPTITSSSTIHWRFATGVSRATDGYSNDFMSATGTRGFSAAGSMTTGYDAPNWNESTARS